MSLALEKYLDRVMICANRNETDAAQIRAELKDHLLKKIDDLQAQGLSGEDAAFQAIEDHGHPRTVGYGLRKRFSWIDVRAQGTARGFIAIGPKAIGIIAIGGAAFGLFAFGGFALGLIAFGGFALAILISFGGFAVAPTGFAIGGFAVGLLACGGFAGGIVAVGGRAIGLWVPMAAKAINYFSKEAVPYYLQYFDAFLTNKQTPKLIMLPFYAVFFPLLLIQIVLTARERNRIKKADPTLVE